MNRQLASDVQLSVIVPVYNEEENIVPFLKRIEAVLNKIEKEVSKLDSIFMKQLTPMLKNFLSPYTEEKWITTSKDYDYDLYNIETLLLSLVSKISKEM